MSASAPAMNDPFPTRLFAPAKVNLALHVVGRRADGLHLLDGLVGFAEVGDVLEVRPAEEDRLVVAGRFADDVPAGADNILLSALELARKASARFGETIEPLEIRLEKALPIAAGIGGGSADAGALLRHLGNLAPSLIPKLPTLASRLGADVPMCLFGRPSRTGSIGEELTPLAMPAVPAVLVNPLLPVPTAAVFGALTRRDNAPLLPFPEDGFETIPALLAYLRTCRNDLEEPAAALFPAIAEVRRSLEGLGCPFVRMSGSGGTVFGLLESPQEATHVASELTQTRASWWVAATSIEGSLPEERR